MPTIKNVRSSILVIPDVKLKLRPGQTALLDGLSSQAQSLVECGYLAVIDPAPTISSQPIECELSKLSAAEAIVRIQRETDLQRLRTYAECEKRRTVVDALKNRLAEVESAAR